MALRISPMRDVLPDPIVTRWNKQGFLPPIAQWLNGGLGDCADAVFNDAAFDQSPHWDAAWCRQAWRRFRSGDTALAPTIWKILISPLQRYVLVVCVFFFFGISDVFAQEGTSAEMLTVTPRSIACLTCWYWVSTRCIPSFSIA